jgi:hypothetical protein
MVKFGERTQKTQDYKITIVVKADVTEKTVKEWLPRALEEGEFKYKIIKIYSTDTTAVDRDDPEYKYLNDIDKLESI